jgi:hypothetical protein
MRAQNKCNDNASPRSHVDISDSISCATGKCESGASANLIQVERLQLAKCESSCDADQLASTDVATKLSTILCSSLCKWTSFYGRTHVHCNLVKIKKRRLPRNLDLERALPLVSRNRQLYSGFAACHETEHIRLPAHWIGAIAAGNQPDEQKS